MLGGLCAFLHNFYLLKAFEGAPSTVLLPLIQVASIWVLLGSSILALFRGQRFMSPLHGLAYALMFVGGCLPATGGDVSRLLRRSFWRQRYVAYAIGSELTLGLHDLLLSDCSREQHSESRSGGSGGEAEQSESFEFFLISRFSFVASFVCMYAFIPSLRRELGRLLSGRVAAKYVVLSCCSEGLALTGYYLVSIAFGLFFQPAIVHAAEASLSQLLNLLLAFALLRFFGIGRSSAVGFMRAKMLSFVMVSIGLVLCTLEEGGAANGAGGNATSSSYGHPGGMGMRTAPLLLPYVANVSYSGELLSNAEFYARYPRAAMTLPTLDNLGFGYRRRGKRWRRRSQRRRRNAAKKASMAARAAEAVEADLPFHQGRRLSSLIVVPDWLR